MDLPSWPEVFAADYVIKSIIISVWAPRLLCFIFFFLCSWVERRVVTSVQWEQTDVHVYQQAVAIIESIAGQFKGPKIMNIKN